MSLPPPNLDDRTYQSLVGEARARIPTFTGEWTNFNNSDPGMTLVQLHAWLTETLIYRVNRLPDLAFVNFLNLLGTTPAPARAAEAELSFRFTDLDKTGDPLTILVPKGVQVGVDGPELAEPVTFETKATLRGINAAVAAILVPGTEADWQLVGTYDPDEATLELTRPFRPFGAASAGSEMRVGLLLRPIRDPEVNYFLDRFPEGELDLTVLTPQVFEKDADGETIAGPFGTECLFPWEVTEAGDELVWEVYQGAAPATDFDAAGSWQALGLRGDDTAGLARSGHLYLDMPPNLPAVPFPALSRTFWADAGLRKPPSTNTELADDVRDGEFIPADLDLAVWKDQLGLAMPPLQDIDALEDMIRAAPPLNFAAVEEESWTNLGYSPSPAPFGLVWLRARLTAALERPPEVSSLHLNTTRAIAALTRSTETLGTSAGRPNQTFKTRRAPILIDPATGEPDLVVELLDSAGNRDANWARGVDFFGADRATKRYLLDPITGVITFGDGVNGAIPVAGTRVLATRYRVGGGAIGNVPPDTITSLKTALPQVKEVTNLRAAVGGSDAETVKEAKLRAPQLLRTRDRAVSADDFSDLALRTPGVDLKSAFALPRVRLDTSVTPPAMIGNSPGAVTVVILPVNHEPTPQPSEDQLRLVCAFLNERRLITTELYVTGPRYLAIETLDVQLIARADADLKAVQDAARAELETYFHPLHGGEDGLGWPFGGDVYLGNVFNLLLSQDGVARVSDLRIGLTGQPADDCADVLSVPDGTLVHLPPAVLRIEVRYPRG
jgi:hypothetical protein